MNSVQAEVTESALMTCKQLAHYLSLSPRKIWSMDADGTLPLPIRLGRRAVRWSREEIDAWLKAGCPCRQVWNARNN